MRDAGRIIFGQPCFDGAEERLLAQTLKSGWIGQGPLVAEFERRLAAYTGAQNCVAVSSCTAALELALMACEVGPGDEVVTTPFTFVATLNAIERVGATPVCVDIDRDTLNITPAAVAAVITPRTKALMPVHFAGQPVDLDGFGRLAERHDLWLIEDAAHAVGGVAEGRPIGGSGRRRSLTCFSFYPNKNLASAEGGAICFADEALDGPLRELRLHGLSGDAWDRYRSDAYRPALAVRSGLKANWTDLQAAIGLPQLDKLEGFLAVRERLAERYEELLAGIDGIALRPRPAPSLRTRHALHLFQVEVGGARGTRDRVLARLLERRIGAAVHYIGLNQHPLFDGRLGGPFPVSDWATDALLTLPLHMHLSLDDQKRIARELTAAAAAEIDYSEKRTVLGGDLAEPYTRNPL